MAREQGGWRAWGEQEARGQGGVQALKHSALWDTLREQIHLFPVLFPAGRGRHHSSRRQIWEEQTPVWDLT